MIERKAWLALNAAELRPRAVIRLLDRYESPQAILDADPRVLSEEADLTPKELERLAASAGQDQGEQLRTLDRLQIELISIRDAAYPTNLRQIHDPPPVLFVRGQFQPSDERCVAIVGTRRVTPYGRLASETLARDLAARGVTVASGLAVGADAAAHRGALSAGGRTIGVLACGLDVLYPRETLELREQATQQGAVISEVPLGTPAKPARFAARNRIVSGLSLAVVVTEAPERSGALITAEIAAEQGREVFAVPGSIKSEFSLGTHALLRDGAHLAASVEDILEVLGLSNSASLESVQPQDASVGASAVPGGLSSDEGNILTALSLQQRHIDEIIQECDIPVSRTNAGLLTLELKGLVRRLPGNMFMRVK
ncbi:MAG: DNA-processing protein DprA [Armatimonadetes bacterium]|nr:DNA-processing protein DprA [Armatimonadota bacterium]